MSKTTQSMLLATALTAFVTTFAPSAWAEDAPIKPKTAQQLKMKTCNAEAKSQGLKRAERKVFMKECLRKKV